VTRSENLAAFIAASAARHPERIAVSMGDTRLTYGALMDAVAELAGGLRAAGVQPGDRVLVYAENSPAYVVSFVACARLGAILTTAYSSFLDDELRYILTNAQPRVALVADELRERFDTSHAASGSAAAVFEIASDRVVGLPDATPVLTDVPVRRHTGVLIAFTSGSTSRPKPVFHSHGGLIGASRIHVRTWHVTADDAILVAVPMAWLYGCVTLTLTGLAAGAHLVVLDHFNPVRALEAIERERVSYLAGVGTMYIKMLDAAEERSLTVDTSSVRLAVAGGEPRNEVALERFRQRFGCAVLDNYSMSECFPFATYDPIADPVPRPGVGGRIVPEAEYRVIDADGAEVPPGEAGVLLVRSVASMICYYGEPELTGLAVDADGWYRTGDLVRIDEERYVSVVGRASDMIIRGGANVSPAEVERVLVSHEAVAEAVVIGAPDETYGERVVAFVALRPGAMATPGDLRAHCGEVLADFKVPSEVTILDALPRTGTGKLLKEELRKRFAGACTPD
jgi:long-chain acyl-CoA synthetase